MIWFHIRCLIYVQSIPECSVLYDSHYIFILILYLPSAKDGAICTMPMSVPVIIFIYLYAHYVRVLMCAATNLQKFHQKRVIAEVLWDKLLFFCVWEVSKQLCRLTNMPAKNLYFGRYGVSWPTIRRIVTDDSAYRIQQCPYYSP